MYDLSNQLNNLEQAMVENQEKAIETLTKNFTLFFTNGNYDGIKK